MLNGIDIMYRDVDDTKIITYLATNSCAGNKLSLKHNAFEFAGNYGVLDEENDNDIRRIPKPELLKYNVVDCLCTWFVYNKNYPIMVADQQLEPYNTVFKPSFPTITNMELVGMCMDMPQVLKAEKELTSILDIQLDIIKNSSVVKAAEWEINRRAMVKKNSELKRETRSISDFNNKFNPNSGKQLQVLLHDILGYEVIDTTKTKQPATGGDTLEKHLNKLLHKFNITDEELM
jgi:DNA polymerase I